MFHIFRGFCRGRFPNFSRRRKVSLMKQSVAPESTSAFMLAIALLVLIETGTCMERNRVVTITELNLWTALTQANGFRRFENPPFQRDPLGPFLVHLLRPWLYFGATYRLAVAGFGCLIVPPLLVPRRRHFCHPLSLHIPDWDVGSNCVDCCWAYSRYAGDSCGSDVPFYGRCNTQLRVGLSAFLLLSLVWLLFRGCTLLVA